MDVLTFCRGYPLGSPWISLHISRGTLRISMDSIHFARGTHQDILGFHYSFIQICNDSVFVSSWPFTLALNSCTTPLRISVNFHGLSFSCFPLVFLWFSLISVMILYFCCLGRIHSHETVVKHMDILILGRIHSVAGYTRFVARYTRFMAVYTRSPAVYTRSPAVYTRSAAGYTRFWPHTLS